ncbi:hypothetical protein BDF21DRAFT_467258 [Thamnidium elegans]|nr:hypothetical protein BDF21DRAFT_467258 [Thamnidium elegans]
MSINSSCFWSLLSLDNLKFIYIPEPVANINISGTFVKEILLDHSLYEFIHPNEIELAKHDLSSFLKVKTLAGSVTRCRLQSFDYIVKSLSSLQKCSSDTQSGYFKSDNTTSSTTQKNDIWKIIDLVIYTATDNTVLAFFHNTDFEPYYRDNERIGPSQLGCCRGRNNFTQEDAMQLIKILKKGRLEETSQDTIAFPMRIFQIVDQHKGTILFIWPPPFTKKGINVLDQIQSIAKKMILKKFKNSSFEKGDQDEIICTRHYYASDTIDFLNEPHLFQRILVPYGTIIFESFHVSSVKLTVASPLYQHYYINHDVNVSNFDTQSPTKCEYITNNNFEVETRTSTPIEYIRKDSQSHSNQQYRLPTINVPPHRPTLPKCDTFPKYKFQYEEFDQPPLPKPSEGSSIEKKRRTLLNQRHELLNSTTNMRQDSGSVKTCARCRTNNSPEWRRGPDGHKTLCNACGLRYSRFRSKQWRTPTNTTTK